MKQEDFSEATAVVNTNKNLMNYLADLYSSLFHKRKEEILVGQLNLFSLDFANISCVFLFERLFSMTQWQ